MTAEDQVATARTARTTRTTRIEPLTRLATGGMADIWLARELGAAGLERIVVVKRLLPHLAREPDIVDMFVSEARFVARLVHPNVVQIHELAEDEEGYFLVMEYVAGCSVRELTMAAGNAEHQLPPEIAVCIVEQACRGAHAAHDLTDPSGSPLGLVHRDISPHNLMIGPGGDVKLLDFGIAKATEAAEATRTGSLKGKHGYMSPEQCRAAHVDRRSDVFALGIVCWELLTGERLFKRESEFATMEAIVNGDFWLPTEARSELPMAFDAVLARALATDVDARFQTAAEFRRALLDAAEKSAVRPDRDRLGEKLLELLGDRLEQRAEALREAASSTAHLDSTVLRKALVHSEPSMDRSTSSSGTGTDDVATVVQRRSVRPGAEASADAEGATSTVRRSTAPDEDATLVDSRSAEHNIAPAVEAPTTEKSPQLTRASPVRRIIIGVVALVAAAAAIALFMGRQESTPTPTPAQQSAEPDVAPTPSGPPLIFAVAPTVEPEVIRRELKTFMRWLGGAMDRPVQLVIPDSYKHTGDLVTTGNAHFGLLPPLLFVRTAAEDARLRPLAVRLYDGSRASDGYLLVHDDAELTKPADLRGRTICHVDRTSTTGFLLPRIWMRDAGLDPDKDVKIVISGDHLAAMRDLSKGKCDAASVYSGAYLSARKQGIPVGAMRVLAITGRVPQDVLVASPQLSDAEAEKLRDTLIAFEPQRDINEPIVGDVLGISGFAAFDPAEFEKIRKAAVQEGMVPSPDAGP